MKRNIQVRTRKIYAAMILFASTLLTSMQSFAQDKKVDININTKSDGGNNVFMQPWVWIVGGAVFILLLVALLRGKKSND